jgi:CRP-like cAMP-binding protein
VSDGQVIVPIDNRRVVAIRQDKLATMLGTSRGTLNALLETYEAQGLLRVLYGQIEIVDFDGLIRIAGPSDEA